MKKPILAGIIVLLFQSYAISSPDMEYSLSAVTSSRNVLSGLEISIGFCRNILPGVIGKFEVAASERDFNQINEMTFAEALKAGKVGLGLRKVFADSEEGNIFLEAQCRAAFYSLKKNSVTYSFDSTTYNYNFSVANAFEYIISGGISSKINDVRFDMSVGYSIAQIPVNINRSTVLSSGMLKVTSTGDSGSYLLDNKVTIAFCVKY
jgi:hypothetical protein